MEFYTIIARMKNLSKLTKRRAVSPVIATVILVAVTITVAVAVAYWMSGIAGQYTQFEKVEIKSAYSKRVDDAGAFAGWNISLTLQNTGSADSTLTQVFINELPVDDYGVTGFGTTGGNPVPSGETGASFGVEGLTLESGQSAGVYILIGKDVRKLSAGTTVNVKIHSAGGMDYIKLVKLT